MKVIKLLILFFSTLSLVTACHSKAGRAAHQMLKDNPPDPDQGSLIESWYGKDHFKPSKGDEKSETETTIHSDIPALNKPAEPYDPDKDESGTSSQHSSFTQEMNRSKADAAEKISGQPVPATRTKQPNYSNPYHSQNKRPSSSRQNEDDKYSNPYRPHINSSYTPTSPHDEPSNQNQGRYPNQIEQNKERYQSYDSLKNRSDSDARQNQTPYRKSQSPENNQQIPHQRNDDQAEGQQSHNPSMYRPSYNKQSKMKNEEDSSSYLFKQNSPLPNSQFKDFSDDFNGNKITTIASEDDHLIIKT